MEFQKSPVSRSDARKYVLYLIVKAVLKRNVYLYLLGIDSYYS